MKSSPEIWKPVPHPGFPYEVSNTGLVRRLSVASDRVRKIHPHRNYEPRLIRHVINNGYHYVTLSAGNRQKRESVHALVLTAFIGARPSGSYGCHNDGDKGNNRIENLRWGTPRSNQIDRVNQGNDQYDEGNGSAKFTEEQIASIREIRSMGATYKQIAEAVGCSKGHAHLVCVGKCRTRKTRRTPSKRIENYRMLGYRIE